MTLQYHLASKSAYWDDSPEVVPAVPEVLVNDSDQSSITKYHLLWAVHIGNQTSALFAKSVTPQKLKPTPTLSVVQGGLAKSD